MRKKNIQANPSRPLINHKNLSSLTLTDILEDLLTGVDELSCLLASTNDDVPAGNISGLLANLINSTLYHLSKKGGLSND